ncbi:hypothetical protein [Paraflavitalea speifideaquila]|uniref:hypothetical protein n=1 Tax=Paraflavitalea speifideaquila TaxID=3076558 RepID=UPI0028EBA859|nr:hypothetical protein [Paraflavitalea speifideiaquila]
MKKANKQLEVQHQLHKLTKQEQENPILVLDAFFDNYHLKDVREALWNWLSAGLTSNNSNFRDSRERSNLLFLYEHLESLTEAAWIILQHRKAAQSKD